MTDTGTVSLVGAGPGDPDLLTVRARRLLDEADVVCYDSFVSEAISALPPASVERIDVGERAEGERIGVGTRAGDECAARGDVGALLARRATAGDDVVRLTGGDPRVFARRGETVERLATAGVPVEVVPGVASALAAPSLAGVPPTHRDHASSVALVADHEGQTAPDWEALSALVDAGGTLVIARGVARLAEHVAALREGGVAPETPVAVVERAPGADGAAVTGTLETVGDRAREAGIDPPAVTVVGDVVSVRDRVAACLHGRGRMEGVGDDPPVPTE